jgi:hypothetical protein
MIDSADLLTSPTGHVVLHTPLLHRVRSEAKAGAGAWLALSSGVNHLHETHAVINQELLPICILYCGVICLFADLLAQVRARRSHRRTSVEGEPRGRRTLE